MGLIFSKQKNKVAPVPIPAPIPEPYPIQAPNHHAHHPSTVSYDFETCKGQIRALHAFRNDVKEEKKDICTPKRKLKVNFKIN